MIHRLLIKKQHVNYDYKRRFLFCQVFTSVFGGILLPYLAEFYFCIWQYFASVFGGVLPPYLAIV
jgi:hypothetical protein